MKHDIAQITGAIGNLDLSLDEGAVQAASTGKWEILSWTASVKLDGEPVARKVGELVKNLIPGHFEDALIDSFLNKIFGTPAQLAAPAAPAAPEAPAV